MTDLRTRLNEDLKVAMKDKDTDRLSAIRMIIAEIKIKDTRGIGKTEDDEIYLVMCQMLRKAEESMATYKQNGRDDLYNKELSQASAIKSYLPDNLNKEKISETIDRIRKNPIVENMFSRLKTGSERDLHDLPKWLFELPEYEKLLD